MRATARRIASISSTLTRAGLVRTRGCPRRRVCPRAQFCTIDPSEARVEVPDPQWRALCDFHKPKSEIPAFLHVFDIAGLVKGASEGAGLGNAFLSHISACDAIFHVCRVFKETADGDEAVHVEGEVNP